MNDPYISWFRGCFLTKNTNVEVVCVRVSVTSRSFSTLFLQKKELEGGMSLSWLNAETNKLIQSFDTTLIM